jgi:hypothetical protein
MGENGFDNKEGILNGIRPEKYPAKTDDSENPDPGVFVFSTIANHMLDYKVKSMKSTPDHICPIRTMPQAADQKCDH